MRSLTLAVLTFAALVFAPAAASAREYPWCLIGGGRHGAGTWSCGYVSFGQCMASRTGNTDMCNINPRYSPPYLPPRKVKRLR